MPFDGPAPPSCSLQIGGVQCTEFFMLGQTNGNYNKTVGRHLTRYHLPWGRAAYECRAMGQCRIRHPTTERRNACRRGHGLDEAAIAVLKTEDEQILEQSRAHNAQFAPPENDH